MLSWCWVSWSPDVGRVRVGGVDLAGIDPDRLAGRRLAWVPQRPYLFAGTVAENIALGRPAPGAARSATAARAARIEHLLDTVVGDGGTGISTGERQRVALARAFLRDAPVRAARRADRQPRRRDRGGGAWPRSARLAAGRTVLLVAHRPALLALADRVVDADRAGQRDPANEPPPARSRPAGSRPTRSRADQVPAREVPANQVPAREVEANEEGATEVRATEVVATEVGAHELAESG